jgi:hypothetical protein
MCGSADELMASCDVIVVSNGSPEFAEAIAKARHDQAVIDLVRIVETAPAAAGEYYGLCW